ncbi:MAG: hypothetical protein NTX69_07150 [Candidatus Bipolaricaulota bacterium]|nr:hypothetical protein [Candidatus Bipolaricaulota bacterium]
MSKSVIWVVLGVLAVAGLSVVAVMQFGPRGEPAASAVPASAVPVIPAPATPVPTAASISAPAVATAAAATPAAASADSKGSAPAPAVVASVPAASSDSGATAAQPSAAVPSATPTIDELIQNLALYEGSPIALRGTILTQCTAGCEFALDDGTGVLSVQLEGKGKDRLIPLGKVGKKIEIHGVFRADPRPQIVIEDPNGWQFVK